MNTLVQDIERGNPTNEELRLIALFLGQPKLEIAALEVLLNRVLAEESPRELVENLVPELEEGVAVRNL